MYSLSRSISNNVIGGTVCRKIYEQQIKLFLVAFQRGKQQALARSFSTSRRHQQEISSNKVFVNGVNLHYEVAGNSPDVILCLPGALGSTRSDFGPQFTGLSDRFTVVAFDPRGYGKSIPPKRDFPQNFFERDADDAANLMLNIGYEKFSLLGWSDGGITGMILAGQRPELIEKLVVWGANAFVTEEDAKMIGATRDTSNWSARMREPLEALYGEEGLKEMWATWNDTFLGFIDTKNGDICTNFLPKIQCPTLVVHGEKDPMVPRFHPDYILKNIKNAKLHLMAEGKHNLHLRYHKEFNDLVSEFLRSP